MEFGGQEDGVHAIRPTQPTPGQSNATALHQKLDSLTKRLESLEVTIGKSQTPNRPGYGRDRGTAETDTLDRATIVGRKAIYAVIVL